MTVKNMNLVLTDTARIFAEELFAIKDYLALQGNAQSYNLQSAEKIMTVFFQKYANMDFVLIFVKVLHVVLDIAVMLDNVFQIHKVVIPMQIAQIVSNVLKMLALILAIQTTAVMENVYKVLVPV